VNAQRDVQRDQKLVEAAKRGDQQAISELYYAYVDRIYRYIFYRVSDVHIAEDITADVFIKVLEGLSTYEDRSLPFAAWIYKISHAKLVDYYRRGRQRFTHQSIDSMEIGVEMDIDEALTQEYETKRFKQALKRLTDIQQEVIILRFIEGHDLASTAEILGKSINVIKVTQFRAVQALSKLLNAAAMPDEQSRLLKQGI
jgi:RNA polymerase sigma-70 factor, ECF subfamily